MSRRNTRPDETGAELPAWARDAEGRVRGSLVPLLKGLHLLTRDGALNADARRKLKQVEHLLGLLEPAVEDVLARHENPVIVDCGAGKSYLGFLLVARFLAPAGRGKVLSIESRAELVLGARRLAEEAGFASRMEFVSAALDAVKPEQLPARAHLVTALHACDTATDDALALALRLGADHVAVVPCCQAEIARQLKEREPPDRALAELAAHPLHRRELGSHLTNVLRTLALEAHGHKVTVTELVGWEHSLKNELILGRRVHRENRAAEARLNALLTASGVRPKLLRQGS